MIEAKFSNGVLTINLPKNPQPRTKAAASRSSPTGRPKGQGDPAEGSREVIARELMRRDRKFGGRHFHPGNYGRRAPRS